MPTVEQILRESGFSDDQIKSIDTKAITAFSGVLSAAEQERQAAELAQRSNKEFYEQSIAPSLNAWQEEKMQIDNERARAAAEVAYYRTQNEEAKKSGFIATDAPGFSAPAQGGYRAAAPGGTPGSPTFFDVSKVYERAGDAVGIIADLQWEHQKLFNQPMPISPTELIRQADAVKLDPKTYAARTFGWDNKRQEIAQQKQQEHDSKVRSEAAAERDKFWAERTGNNPDVRPMVSSRFSDLRRAVSSKDLPDPLALSDSERRKATAAAIRADLTSKNDAA
jgi:hypothetical protein